MIRERNSEREGKGKKRGDACFSNLIIVATSFHEVGREGKKMCPNFRNGSDKGVKKKKKRKGSSHIGGTMRKKKKERVQTRPGRDKKDILIKEKRGKKATTFLSNLRKVKNEEEEKRVTKDANL